MEKVLIEYIYIESRVLIGKCILIQYAQLNVGINKQPIE